MRIVNTYTNNNVFIFIPLKISNKYASIFYAHITESLTPSSKSKPTIERHYAKTSKYKWQNDMRILETYEYASKVSKFFVLGNEKICLGYHSKVERRDSVLSFIRRVGSRTPICK